jgi:hypothetical protein
MLFHRERSKPLMEKLKAMCEEKLRSKRVEPSSAIWEPLTFIINQWARLTRFYEAPGVPLDTNLVEQKLIIPVRFLAASFNYQIERQSWLARLDERDHQPTRLISPAAHLPQRLRKRILFQPQRRRNEEPSNYPDDFRPWNSHHAGRT